MDVVLCWIKNINQLINKDFSSEIEAIFSFLSLFFFFFFFRAAPMAHGNSQTRGQIGAAAANLHHSHSSAGSKPCLPTQQIKATPDP